MNRVTDWVSQRWTTLFMIIALLLFLFADSVLSDVMNEALRSSVGIVIGVLFAVSGVLYLRVRAQTIVGKILGVVIILLGVGDVVITILYIGSL